MKDERRTTPALDGIVKAIDRARMRAPASGPGWTVCFKDRAGRVLLSCTMASYAQVECLVEEAAALGYTLLILDGDLACDFAFVRADEGGADILVAEEAPSGTEIGRLPPSAAATARAILRGSLVMEDGGGPVMHVRALSGELAFCVWFSEGAEVCGGMFPIRKLVNVDAVHRVAAEPVAPR